MHISVKLSLMLTLENSTYPKNLFATESRASFGQGGNQSRVQQFTREGNFLHLTLRASPTGDIHKIICKCSLTLSTKKFQSDSGESGLFYLVATGLILLTTPSISSFLE